MNPKLTQNQVVAHNLRRARELRGWTQEHAAEELEPYLGVRWSKASFSAAERSVRSNRTRQFNADEIVAFAQAFGLPVMWFFLPPDDEVQNSEIGLAIETVLGDHEGLAHVRERLATIFGRLPRERLTQAQGEYRDMADLSASSMMQAMWPDSERVAATLIEVAKFIGDRPKKAKRASKSQGASRSDDRKRQE